MIIIGQDARVPVRLITSAGANATGIAVGDILNGTAQFIKSNGTKNSLAINGGSWIEVDSVQSPGLYQLVIPFGINSVAGPVQYSVYPAATAFTAFVGTETATVDLAAIKAKTDLIPASPATETTSLSIKAKTDNLPASPAATGDITAATVSIKGAQDLSISTIAGGVSFVSNADNLHAIRQAIAGAGNDPWLSVLSGYSVPGTMGYALRMIHQVLAGKSKISINDDRLIVYDLDGTTILASWYLRNENGKPSIYDIKERLPVG